jgi:hypothetical protein
VNEWSLLVTIPGRFEVQIFDFTADVRRGAMEAVGGTTPTTNQLAT